MIVVGTSTVQGSSISGNVQIIGAYIYYMDNDLNPDKVGTIRHGYDFASSKYTEDIKTASGWENNREIILNP